MPFPFLCNKKETPFFPNLVSKPFPLSPCPIFPRHGPFVSLILARDFFLTLEGRRLTHQSSSLENSPSPFCFYNFMTGSTFFLAPASFSPPASITGAVYSCLWTKISHFLRGTWQDPSFSPCSPDRDFLFKIFPCLQGFFRYERRERKVLFLPDPCVDV